MEEASHLSFALAAGHFIRSERVAPLPEPVESKRPAVIAPLSPRRYEIRVTVDQETHDRLRQLQDLLADRDPAAIVSRALELLLDRTLAKKAAP